MKMKKKQIFAILAVLLVLVLGACGTSEESAKDNKAADGVNGSGEKAPEQNDDLNTGSDDSASDDGAASDDAAGDDSAAGEDSKNVQKAEVTYNGMVDGQSVEVENGGETMVLRTDKVEGVDFSKLNPGDKADVEYYENENGQFVLVSYKVK